MLEINTTTINTPITTSLYCWDDLETTTTTSGSSSNDPFNNNNNDNYSPETLTQIKPHRCSESAFEAIASVKSEGKRSLSFSDFRLIRRVGSGDISTVYLCRLRSDESAADYAMKVVDRDALALKNKTQRAQMEKKILNMLDHPFLPTLYAHFHASHFSCIVMEFCSAGDLHSLRHKLPSHRFTLSSARDLKPENVLVRSDGHIMLSDFDLSLCSDSIPSVHSPCYSSPSHHTAPTPLLPSSPKKSASTNNNNNHTQLFSCLPYNRLFRSKKIESLTNNRLFVAEPVTARSCSFVGTHEYISPEVASGNSHGNAVDWWAFGIFLYEMIYGRTPFVGLTNSITLRNILKKSLTFPTQAPSSTSEAHARDLISGLLNKDPASRLGSILGAADVKTHPFFKDLNFALIRSVTPPKVPIFSQHNTDIRSSFKDGIEKELNTFDYF
ncbi:Protein kinase PINOID [Bienertia sinuspersici]